MRMSKRWHEGPTDQSREADFEDEIIDLDAWRESQAPRAARRKWGQIRRRLDLKLEELRFRESIRDELSERREGRRHRAEADGDDS
jgi:hypothetical protein